MARKFADWVKTRTDRLSDDQMQAMLGNEHGGMNEALANLYARTGDDQVSEAGRAIQPQGGSWAGLRAARHPDRACTPTPRFPSSSARRENTSSPARNRSRPPRASSGTPSSRSDPTSSAATATARCSLPRRSSRRRLGPNTTETCNTYNMLKLTRHLFEWDPRAEYADYYERALYNHILASQNPETGMMCYYVPAPLGVPQGLQRLRRRLLVLHRHGRREPCQVRR